MGFKAVWKLQTQPIRHPKSPKVPMKKEKYEPYTVGVETGVIPHTLSLVFNP